MKVTVLRNDRHVPPGHIERAVRSAGHEFDLLRLDEGAALPVPADLDAVIILGGEMGAYDVEEFPYLTEEKIFLRQAVEIGVPVLGVCLGCQLLADSLGGSAYLAAAPELTLGPLPTLVDDDVVGVLGTGPTLTIHRDTWDLPAGATLIARSDRYNQAFRFGSALGVQPHPEVDHEIVESWLSTDEGRRLAEGAGTEAQAVIQAFHLVEAEVRELADRFFGEWLDEADRIRARR
jgi:GMP synthase (glutamine-hydrolysing)